MPYIGQSPATGEANSFKTLDNIASYTLTFDGSSASTVSVANDTITERNHRFVTGQRVTYNDGGGTAITGLSDGVYYIIVEDRHTIKLAANANNAAAGTAINLTGLGVGSSHTLNVAFDGVNTKFKATINNGTRADITSAPQLMLSINGVLQQPHNNTTSPTTGYAVDHTSTIIFSAAPAANDQFFASLVASNFATFDISDNIVDNFTGDGSTTDFTLSKAPPNNESVLVTIDGVVQYPDDTGAVRAYTVSENILTFASAPGSAVEIQVRHIGFAGASTGGISGFYGRTGNAVLKNTDNIVFNNATASGTVQAANVTVTGDLTVNGTTTTLDTELTSVDKLEVDANNTTVAAAVTQRGSGDILNLYDGSTEVFSVVDGGKVGIGLTDAGGTGCDPDGNQLLIRAATTVGTTKGHIMLTGDSATNGQGPQIVFSESGSGSSFAGAYVGHVRTGSNSTGDLVFGTRATVGDANTVPTERLRIRSDGKVLIGNGSTYTPSGMLHIVGDDNSNGPELYLMVPNNNATDNIGALVFGNNVDKSVVKIQGVTHTANNTGDLTFHTSTTGTMSEKLRIESGGGLKFTGQGTSIPVAGILHHTNNNLYVRGGTVGLILSNQDNTNTIHISESNYIKFETTDGTERLRIDSNGYLGLNNAAPHNQYYNNLVIGDGSASGDKGITIRTQSSNEGVIAFSDADSGAARYAGKIAYNHGSNAMMFFTTNGDERLRVGSDGKLTSTRTSTTAYDSAATTNDSGFLLLNHGAAGHATLQFQSLSGGTAQTGQATISSFNETAGSKNTALTFGTRQNSDATIRERLRIDSDGRLLAGGAVAANAWPGGDDLILGNTTSGTRTGITLVSGSDTDGGLYWSHGTSNDRYAGQIAYNHSNDRMQFYTAASARVTIDNAGRFLIGRTSTLQSSAERLTIDSGMGIIRNNSTGTGALYLRNEDSTADTRHPYLIFTDGSGNRGGIGIQNDASSMWIHGQNGIAFRTSGTSPGTAERLRIHSSGATTMHVNNADHDTFRFTTQGVDEAKLIMRDASDNEDIVLNTGGDSWINSADFGIGTNSPGAKLDVLNGTSDGTITRMRNDEVGIVYGVWGTGSAYPRETTINGTRFDNGTSPYLRIAGQGGIKFCVDLNSERLRIDSNGKVGINSTTPTARVDINHPHTEQGLIVRSRYGNIADAMVKFDGDPAGNGGDGNVLHIHGGSSRTDSEILHIDSTGAGDIFDIRGDGLTRVYKQLQLEHSSNVAKIIFNEYGANDPKAQIEMDQVNGSSGQLIFRTQQSGTLAERFRISSGGTLHYLGENQTVASGGGSAKKVLVTNAYEEWHFTWSGASSKTATFTCPSYFHAEVIYTSHQTNGGSDIHRYVRGKWANNHTTHTWVQHEDVGNTWAITSFSISATHNGGNQANGKLIISETYGSGSLSNRAVIMRIYYGQSGLGWDIA